MPRCHAHLPGSVNGGTAFEARGCAIHRQRRPQRKTEESRSRRTRYAACLDVAVVLGFPTIKVSRPLSRLRNASPRFSSQHGSQPRGSPATWCRDTSPCNAATPCSCRSSVAAKPLGTSGPATPSHPSAFGPPFLGQGYLRLGVIASSMHCCISSVAPAPLAVIRPSWREQSAPKRDTGYREGAIRRRLSPPSLIWRAHCSVCLEPPSSPNTCKRQTARGSTRTRLAGERPEGQRPRDLKDSSCQHSFVRSAGNIATTIYNTSEGPPRAIKHNLRRCRDFTILRQGQASTAATAQDGL